MSALEQFLTGQETLVWPDVFPERLSPSSIALAASCPEKWRRRYIQHDRDRWGGAALVGLAVHKAAEHNYRQKIDTHTDLPMSDVRELTAVAFDEKRQEAEKDGIDWRDIQPGDAKDESVRLMEAYHAVGSPEVQPVAVEERVEILLPGLPPVHGYVDVRTATSIPDIKTTGRKMTSPRGDWRLKGSMYVLMTGLQVEWHVVTKTKVPGIYTPSTEPGLVLPASELVKTIARRRLETTATTLVGMLDRYGPDEAWPTNAPEHEWACSYCSWKSTCAWWQG